MLLELGEERIIVVEWEQNLLEKEFNKVSLFIYI